MTSDYRGMAKWFGAQYNQEVHFNSAVKCNKGPQVLTSLLNQKRNYYYYYKSLILILGLNYYGLSLLELSSIMDVTGCECPSPRQRSILSTLTYAHTLS